VPRRDPATACRSLGGHDLAVTAVTAVTVGIRIPRTVTAVIIAPAVTAVTRRAFVELSSRALGAWATVTAATAVTGRAFVTRLLGDGGHRGRRDRRDRGNGVPPRPHRGRRDDRGRRASTLTFAPSPTSERHRPLPPRLAVTAVTAASAVIAMTATLPVVTAVTVTACRTAIVEKSNHLVASAAATSVTIRVAAGCGRLPMGKGCACRMNRRPNFCTLSVLD
jgi:hypothetical protein